VAAERVKLSATSVTLAAPDPRKLAAFYARLLDVEVTQSDPPRPDEPVTAGWSQIRTTSLTLNFEFERYWEPPVWPAQSGRQIATQHLDIWVADLEAAVAWAVECGARIADAQPQDHVRVMVDPAGHPFCLFR
jgi:catechol 2,3-dioxygenase-like lactoylglutathione lyase family enzyme